MTNKFDSDVVEGDFVGIIRVARETKTFPEFEIEFLQKLLNESLGDESYHFLILRDESGEVLAFACVNEIMYTNKRFELQWIFVAPELRGSGIAQELLAAVEEIVRKQGGNRLYVETSNIEDYNSARAFYEKSDFELQASLSEYYDLGDHKLIYCKIL